MMKLLIYLMTLPNVFLPNPVFFVNFREYSRFSCVDCQIGLILCGFIVGVLEKNLKDCNNIIYSTIVF
jgi:hypothetical protein